MSITTAVLGGQEVKIVKTGVGKVNAAMAMTKVLDDIWYDITEVINVGTAGTISDVKIGDVMISEKAVQYDFDLTPFGRSIGEIPNTNNPLCLNEDLVKRAQMSIEAYVATVVSADQFLHKDDQVERIRNCVDDKMVFVDMEAAALAQVCSEIGVPFISIKGISDIYGQKETNVEQFKKNLKLAARRSAEACVKLLESEVSDE